MTLPPAVGPMAARTLRVALAASALLASGAALLAFLAAPQLGSAYERLIRPLGTERPLLTAEVALPLLRVAPGGPHRDPVTSPGAAAVWLVLLLGPWAGLAWALRAHDAPDVLARWVVASSIYVPVAAAVVGVVLLGLALPFGCL